MVKETDYYEILEVRPDCSADEMKKSYKKLSLQYHPDKNPTGDDEHFKNITQAYRILSDENNRAIYDEQGQAAFVEEVIVGTAVGIVIGAVAYAGYNIYKFLTRQKEDKKEKGRKA